MGTTHQYLLRLFTILFAVLAALVMAVFLLLPGSPSRAADRSGDGGYSGGLATSQISGGVAGAG
jgi:hypothetical protein